jgi:hypothetical protein
MVAMGRMDLKMVRLDYLIARAGAKPPREPRSRKLAAPKHFAHHMSLRCVGLLCLLWNCPSVACADEDAERLRLQALVQEGDLLLAEWTALKPERDRIAADAQRIDAGEQALRSESADLNQAITAFNAAHTELARGAEAHAAECPLASEDKAVVDACNARAAALRERARDLEGLRPALQARQRELKARLDRQNAGRREWAERKHTIDARVELSRGDTDQWLASVHPFLASAVFQSLARRAGEPQACAAQRLREIEELPGDQSLERAQACLRAVQAGMR